MAKKPSTLKNMLIALFVITAVSGGLLGLVYGLTKDTIKDVEKEKTKKAIKEVLPLEEEFDTKDTTITFDDNGVSTSLPCYIAYNANKDPIGIAIKTTEGGFGGNIELMVGIIPPGIIKGVSVLSHSETPGLGANMTGPFKDQFTDKNPSEFKLAVKKDGGDVDAITAATITSRAFSKAIDKAYRAFQAFHTVDPASINYRLDPPAEDNIEEVKIEERNIMNVCFTKNNEILINGHPSDLSSLKEEVKQFMTPRQDDDSAPEVEFKQIDGLEQEIMISKGIISLKTDRTTSYSKYVAVQNELARAFTELRDEMSMKHFKKPYNQLTEEEMKAIDEAIPVRVSEAEPCEKN